MGKESSHYHLQSGINGCLNENNSYYYSNNNCVLVKCNINIVNGIKCPLGLPDPVKPIKLLMLLLMRPDGMFVVCVYQTNCFNQFKHSNVP